jgi:hypothetical protein
MITEQRVYAQALKDYADMTTELATTKNKRGALAKWLNRLAPRVRPGYPGDPWDFAYDVWLASAIGINFLMAERLTLWRTTNSL